MSDTAEDRWLAALRARRAAGAYEVATLEDVERLIHERDACAAVVRAADELMGTMTTDLLPGGRWEEARALRVALERVGRMPPR